MLLSRIQPADCPAWWLTNVVSDPNEIAIIHERMNIIDEINVNTKTVTVYASVFLLRLKETLAEIDQLFLHDLG